MGKSRWEKIPSRQMFACLVLLRLVNVLISFPTLTGIPFPQNLWIATIIGTLLFVPPIILVVFLGTKFPDKTIIEYSQLLLGSFIGRILGIILVGLWLYTAARAARDFGESFVIAVMPETPLLVFIVIATFLASNAAKNGLEVIGRMAGNAVWIVLFFVVSLLLLSIGNFQFNRMLPILPTGLGDILRPTGIVMALYFQFFIVGMIIPSLNVTKNAYKSVIASVLVSGVVMTAFSVGIVSAFGPNASALTLPVYSLARLIVIGEFFERLEIIPLAAWSLALTVKLSLFIWASMVGIAQVIGIKEHAKLAYPIGVVVIFLSQRLFSDLLDFEQSFEFPMPSLVPVSLYSVILILLLTVYFIRRGEV